jgi:hypothetical protein
VSLRHWLLATILAGAAQAVPVSMVDGTGALVPLDGELRTASGPVPVKAGVADVPFDGDSSFDVTLVAAGWWALPATVTQGGAQMRVWTTGMVRGRSVTGRGVAPPSSITAVVEVPPLTRQSPAIPRGTRFDCEIASGGAFVCELPSGSHDLVFRSKGLTPHYRWSVNVSPGRTSDLGTFQWRQGASLVAWLDRDAISEALAAGQARATVTRVVSGAPSLTGARLSVPVAEATFNDRGYVQLAPLSAGMYSLEVSAPGFARARVSPIELFEGSESVLRKPIVLEEPISITLSITPPVDPGGEPWSVRFSRLPDAGSLVLTSSSKEIHADEAGRVVIEGESPGRFNVSVTDAGGDRVASKDLVVSSRADASQAITIERHLVRGQLLLGNDPLTAEVIFGMRNGSERVTVRSDGDGVFRGLLPRLGKWPVEIRDSAQNINVQRVEEVREDEPLVIRLGDGQISGLVVDSQGRAVPKAPVLLATGGLGQSHTADDAGQFQFRGLEGVVTLGARHPRSNEESPMVSVDVQGGKSVANVRLELRGQRTVGGRVICDGQPVAGAFVAVHPGGGGYVRKATTDLTGQFEVTLGVDERTVTYVVAAAGRTMAAFQLPISDESATFALDSIGGEVVIHLPRAFQGLTFLHNAAPISLNTLAEWSQAHGFNILGGGETITIPSLARGSVRACARVAGGGPICKEALLLPRASAILDLRE